jgi:hypothetical protein
MDERLRGLDCLASGDAGGAVPHFWAALADPGQTDVPHYLGVSLCLSGDDAGFLKLVDACQGDPDTQLDFYQTILLDLMKRRAWAALSRHAGHAPAGTRLQPVATYYAGCAALAQGDHDRALQHFGAFRSIVLPRHKQFPLLTSATFNLIFRQACLIEAPDAVAEIAALPETHFERGRPRLDQVGAWTLPSGQVFLCCCDGAYFKRFAAELYRSVEHWRPDVLLHFHVAQPDETTFSLATDLATLGGLAVNVTVERAPTWRHNVYYACNRFLVAPTLMDRYQKPLVILDADSVLLNALDDITKVLPSYDFACFNTGRTEPASLYQATITHFADNESGRRLLEILARLVILKLDMPWTVSWMLDQAALYSALRYAERYAPEIRIGDLAALTGRDLRAFIGGLGSEDEKWHMMTAVGSIGPGTDSRRTAA